MRYKRIGLTGPRMKRVGTWFIVALGVWLAAAKVVDTLAPAPRVGHWKSAEARARYLQAYAEVLAQVPPPDEVLDVPTRAGSVRVTVWRGSAPGSPVVLLPGHSSGAPMWAENLASWIGLRTIYAFDPIGDAGLSAQSTPLTRAEDQADWIADAIGHLRIAPAHVVGHSFGGANAALFAVTHPRLVATLTLLEPVIVVRPLPASTYLWSAVLALPTPQSWRDRALAEIGGTTVADVRRRTPMSVMIDSASTGYETALPMPRTLTDDQWRSLTMPVRLDVGGASTLSGGQAAADRIRGLLPNAEVRVWPGVGHSLPMDRRDDLGPALLAFWAR